MTEDISHILETWRFNPDEPSVRIVRGGDGREKIQMRVDLGVLQMEMSGRPDGERPHGCESLLEWYQSEQQAHDATHLDSAPFRLDEEACAHLWREGVQYYHRYMAFWVLKLYDLCARDTARNLRLFRFVREYAPEDHIKMHFDQWRPYVTMMHTRSVATPLLDRNDVGRALAVVESGIERIQEFLDEYDLADREEECQELQNLENWRSEILSQSETSEDLAPETRIDFLRKRLREAVEREEFEAAARLRDEIRRLLRDKPT